jgi:hypothetical protein
MNHHFFGLACWSGTSGSRTKRFGEEVFGELRVFIFQVNVTSEEMDFNNWVERMVCFVDSVSLIFQQPQHFPRGNK